MKHFWPSICIVVTGVAFSIGGYKYSQKLEAQNTYNEFVNSTQDHTASIVQSMESKLLLMESIHNLFAATNGIERFEFQTFVDPFIQELDGVRALEWVPRVLLEDREAFEASIQASGNAEFYIKEWGAEGQLIRAGERPEYFPIIDLESQQNLENVSGFDVSSETARFEALSNARTTGKTAITAPIQLVQGADSKNGIQVFMPLYTPGMPQDTPIEREQNIVGFIMGVFYLPDLIDSSLSILNPGDLTVELYDTTNTDSPHILYSSITIPEYENPALTPSTNGYPLLTTLAIGDRNWTIRCDVTPDFHKKHASSIPVAILLIGLFITSLLTFHFINNSRNTLALSQSNQALIDNQYFLDETLSLSPMVIWGTDKDGIITISKGKALKSLGLAQSELVGTSIFEYLKDDETGLENIKRAFAGDNFLVFSNVDGSHWMTHYNAHKDQNGTIRGMTGTSVDITESKQAEFALKESQDKLAKANTMLQLVLDTIPVRVFWKDADLKYLGCNEKFALDAGKKHPSELINKNDFELAWKDHAELYCRDDRAVMNSKEARYNFIETQTTPEGETIQLRTSKVPLLDEEGNVFGILGTYEDITEQALVQSEIDKLTQALEESSNEIYIFDVDTLQFTYCNRGALKNTGYSFDEMQTMTPVDIKPEYSLQEFEVLIQALKIGEHSELIFETVHQRKDGTTYPVDIRLSLSKTGAGEFFLAIILDISARRAQEEEQAKLELQIQHAQKLESLGVLAGGIAHDFNNLLLGILGNADLALMNLSPSAMGRDYIEEIVTISQRAADLCKQMLAYSGKGRFVVKAVSLSEIVEDMAHLLEISISKRAVIKYNFYKDLPAVEADITQVRQVVMNLITNASDAVGDKSGIITIGTGAQECDKVYFESTYCDDDLPEGLYIYMEVSDTGCGMDEEIKARIFDPFFTSKETGRGLGMAAVLGIVRGHSGAVKVYSEPGRGTSIKVLFPASDQAAERLNKSQVLENNWQGEGTVLVVDDDSTIRALTRRILEMGGFKVLSACDGREGVDIYREHKEEIKAVLLDMTMPRLNGEEAFWEMRQIQPNVKVVLTSGYNEQDATNRFAGKGLAAFIQKPYQANDLLKIFQQILEQ